MIGVRRAVAQPTLGLLLGAVFVLVGFVLGLRALGDNSFLTHLATGRLILDSGSVPSSDPYSFTAPGEPWVVQSWLMSVLYAVAEELGGGGAIRVLVGIQAGALLGVVWRLTRPLGGVLVRGAVAALPVAIGAEAWAERPFMTGLLGIGLVLLVAHDRVPPWSLLPAGLVWVNSHGSFPLGLVLLLALALGSHLDGERPRRELTAAAWLAGGVVLGVLGPLGIRGVVFPFDLLSRSGTLSHVVEWRAPPFEDIGQRAFLVLLVVAVLALVRRPSWRGGVPLALFAVAAITSARNIPVTTLVAIPVLAGGLPSFGSLHSTDRPRLGSAVAAVLLLAVPLVAVARLQQPDYRLQGRYPTTALAWQASEGIGGDVRQATPEFVGNLLTVLYGPDGRVFFDDRFDMYPTELFRDHRALGSGSPRWTDVLDRYEIDIVTWGRDEALAALVAADPGWRLAYSDDRWVVGCRRGAVLTADRTC